MPVLYGKRMENFMRVRSGESEFVEDRYPDNQDDEFFAEKNLNQNNAPCVNDEKQSPEQ